MDSVKCVPTTANNRASLAAIGAVVTAAGAAGAIATTSPTTITREAALSAIG